MGWVDDVQAWLSVCDGSTEADPVVDIMEIRRALWPALAAAPPNRRLSEHKRWTQEGFVERFAASMVQELHRGLGAEWDVARLCTAVIEAMREQVTEDDPAMSWNVEAMELRRLTSVALDEARAGTDTKRPREGDGGWGQHRDR